MKFYTVDDFFLFYQDRTPYDAWNLGFNISKISPERLSINEKYHDLVKDEYTKLLYQLKSSKLNKAAIYNEYFVIPVLGIEITKEKALEYFEKNAKELNGHKVIWRSDLMIAVDGKIYTLTHSVDGKIVYPPYSSDNSEFRYIEFKDEFLNYKPFADFSLEERNEIDPALKNFYVLYQHINKQFSRIEPLEWETFYY